MPIWTFHGDADEAVPVSASRDMVNALEKVGADIIYTEIPGWGHHAWKIAHNSRIVYDWLFSR
jgi:predicted peptidase